MVDVQSIAREVVRGRGVAFKHLSAITLNRARGDQNLVILLVFLDGGAEPSFLVKITPDAEGERRLRNEHDNLAYLFRHGSDLLRAALPEPVCLTEIDGRFVFAETAFPGTRMKNFPPDRYFASRDFPEHLDQVARWLVEFHRVGAGDDPLPLAGEDSPRAAITEYRAGFDVSPALDALLDTTEAATTGATLPACPWHEDFCTANVLTAANNRIQVIDWEHPLRRSWPLADLLHFLNSVWCVPYAKGQAAKEANYRRLLFESHDLDAPLRAALTLYVDGLSLPRDSLVPLSVMSWVVHANRKRRRLQEIGARPDASEHWPLVMFDRNRCLNLEILAERLPSYVLSTI